MTGSRETMNQTVQHHDELVTRVKSLLRELARHEKGLVPIDFAYTEAEEVREILKAMEKR
jgi:hypothetical protein